MHTEKTSVEHWDSAWAKPPRPRLPSSLNIDTRNMKALLRRYVRPGASVLEIGFAPGKILLWVAARLQAQVTGLDYSPQGLARARELFQAMKVEADLRCEDVFRTELPAARFDFVYSCGLIEHFDDPREIVEQHVRLTRPGGTTLILIPNYGGWLGRVQRHLDAANLDLHNLQIMSPERLAALAPAALTGSSRTYYAGRFSPWLLSLEKRLPRSAARLLSHAGNMAAHCQPMQIDTLSPMLALEIVRLR